jgi:hypothetical protein
MVYLANSTHCQGRRTAMGCARPVHWTLRASRGYASQSSRRIPQGLKPTMILELLRHD